MTEYEVWRSHKMEDPDLAAELEEIQGDAAAINDRFYCSLDFGTAGLRGVIGAGTNRMNIYTIGQATQGLANYLKKNTVGRASVAIAYDSRIKSDLFARESAAILAANGIQAYFYPWLSPTPTLSYAVRYLKCDAGICVTASHNPAKYNGYKVYGSDGCQITAQMAEDVQNEIKALNLFQDVQKMSFEEGMSKGLIKTISDDCIVSYLEDVLKTSVLEEKCDNMKVVYTPLNGTGRVCCMRIMNAVGVGDVTIVPEQEMPDGNFPTCPFPNPEIREALQKGLELCERNQADLLIATDPDADRCGIAVRQNDKMVLLNGNEVGVLLMDFLAHAKKEAGTLPEKPVAVTTIVSTDMADCVAAEYGVELRRVLTGFKYIGDQIALLEEKQEENRFLLGFEESYGYLSGGYVRDKDAVSATMLICEMASWYKRQGKTLVDAMEALYQKHGYYLNDVCNFGFEGEDGMKTMTRIMETLRAEAPKEIAGFAVTGWSDYQRSVRSEGGEESSIDLPCSNVLEYRLEDGNKVIVRPSGTEPKIKMYLSGKGRDRAQAQEIVERLKAAANPLLGIQ